MFPFRKKRLSSTLIINWAEKNLFSFTYSYTSLLYAHTHIYTHSKANYFYVKKILANLVVLFYAMHIDSDVANILWPLYLLSSSATCGGLPW